MELGISPVTGHVLSKAGWKPGLQANVSHLEKPLALAGFVLHDYAREFLREFYLLEVAVPIADFPGLEGFIHFEPLNVARWFLTPEMRSKLKALVNEPLCPIGTTSGHTVFILMDGQGRVYLLDMDWSVFARLEGSISKVLNILCDGRNGRVDSLQLINGKPSGKIYRESDEQVLWELDQYPDLKEFFPRVSLAPARRPPTVCAMPKSAQSVILSQKTPRNEFAQVVVTSGGFSQLPSGDLLFLAHCENCVATLRNAGFRLTGYPPGILDPLRIGESITYTPPASWLP